MAAPQGAPQGALQGAPQGETPADRALAALQAMVNGILIQTGRIFADPTKRKPPFAENTRKSLETSIPAGIARYNDALNDLEGELQLAKHVFRRDLGLLQIARRQREQAEAAERERAAAQSSAAKSEPPQDQTNGATEDSGAMDGDVAMLDDLLPKDNGSATDELDDIAMFGKEPTNETTATKKEPSKSPAADQTVAPDAQDDQAAQVEKQAEEETFDKAPDDYDIDSMFEDLEANASPTANASDPNAMSTDMDFTLPDANDTSGASLLPGLESYANIGESGDTSMPDQTTNNLDDLLKLPGADSGAGNAGDIGTAGGEPQQEFQDTNFDDLFDASGIDGGETEPLEFDDWLQTLGN